MRGAIPPLPQYVFMAWCLVKHRENFTFTFTLNGHRHALLTIVLEVTLMNREKSAECWNCNPTTDAGASIPPSRGKIAWLAITTASSLTPTNTIPQNIS
jgi:hypothetical protein